MSIKRWTWTQVVGLRVHGEWDGEWVTYADHVAALDGMVPLDKVGEVVAANRPRTLTADDPIPAENSVVLDRFGAAWQRLADGWYRAGSIQCHTSIGASAYPVRLIHDGGRA